MENDMTSETFLTPRGISNFILSLDMYTLYITESRGGKKKTTRLYLHSVIVSLVFSKRVCIYRYYNIFH